MKDEAIKFYAENNLTIRGMIHAGSKRGLPPEAVLEAAEIVYDEIQDGLQVKPLRIAWRVFEKAGPLVAIKEQEKVDTLAEIKQTLQDLKAQMEWHLTPWYKKLWRWLKNVGT